MNNSEFMNLYCEQTPLISEAIQKALLYRAKLKDCKEEEVKKLKEILREGKTHE